MSERDPLYWDDAYPLALMLKAAHPEISDPTMLDWQELRSLIIRLEGFADAQDVLPLECLKRIQVEWVELQ